MGSSQKDSLHLDSTLPTTTPHVYCVHKLTSRRGRCQTAGSIIRKPPSPASLISASLTHQLHRINTGNEHHCRANYEHVLSLFAEAKVLNDKVKTKKTCW